jgi:hypothetical protein
VRRRSLVELIDEPERELLEQGWRRRTERSPGAEPIEESLRRLLRWQRRNERSSERRRKS